MAPEVELTRAGLHIKLLVGGTPFSFENIPEEHRDFYTLKLWLKSNLGSLKDIPSRYISDDLIITAVDVGQKSSSFDPAWESAEHILSQPEYAHIHEAVLMVLVERGERYIKKIDQSMITRDFMLKALELNGDCLRSYLNDA